MLTHGPVAYWRLGESSGVTAVDVTGGENGTYQNGVTLAATGVVSGDSDTAAEFAGGANDRVQVSPFDVSGSGLTIVAWFKVNNFGNDSIVSKSTGTGTNATDWLFGINGRNRLRSRIRINGTTRQLVTNVSSMTAGEWYFAALTFDRSTMRVYLNAAEVDSGTWSGAVATNPAVAVALGNQPAGAGNRAFAGVLDEVAVLDKALSAAEIFELYATARPTLLGHWKLNETSGTTGADSTAFAQNGTVSGGAGWSTRCDGTGVFDFDGSNQYISIPNASHLQPRRGVTIAGWVRGDSWGASTDVDIILRKGEGNPNNYQLAIADGRPTLYLDDSDGAGFRGNTVLTPGQWYHVAGTWDGSNVRIYVNGQLDNTPAARSGTIGTDNRPLYIGGRSGTDRFDGMIYDVQLYSGALSQTEIAALMGMAGNWQFSEGSGLLAADSSGTGSNATLSGGASWTTDCAGNSALLTNGMGGIAQTASAFAPPNAGTVAFWMQSSAAPGNLPIFGSHNRWEVRQINNGTVVFDLGAGGGADFATTVPLNDISRWYHVAATFDSATDSYAIYIDGEPHKSGTNGNDMTPPAAAILSFGTRTGSSNYWAGALRDVRIYSRQLCPAEIAEVYGFGGHWKLDETSGITAADSSGLDRNGVVIGSPAWTSGTVDNALQVGSSTFMEVNSLLGRPKNITLAAWANLTAKDSNGAELVSLGDYFAIRLDEGASTKVFFYNGSGWTFTSTSQTFLNAGWHHFAAVFNDDQNWCKLYVDGVEATSLSTNVTIPYIGLGSKLVVGRHGNSKPGWTFTGKIDDVRVYSRALCPVEIQDLHNMGSGAFGGVKIIKWVEIQ